MAESTLAAALLLFGLGAYGVLVRRNLIRICLALSIMETSVILMLAALAYRPGASAPILDPDTTQYVDPLPHALALTAIVIAAAMTALALALAVQVHRRLGTLRIDEIQRRVP